MLLSSANVMTFADKAYQGARGTIRPPFKRHRYRPKLSRRQKAVNRTHVRIRFRGDRANATLKPGKSWSSYAVARAERPDRAGHSRPTPRRKPSYQG
jgi:hypothetical protein